MVFRIERSVSIFLERETLREVEQFREQYDPLFSVIPPHVTLVFPFESSLATQECIDHLNDTLAHAVKFHVSLNGFHITADHCLFYLIEEGKDAVETIHDRLYSGKLKCYKSAAHEFIPHVTIGRFKSAHDAQNAFLTTEKTLPTHRFKVHQITLEQIGKDGESVIEYTYKLRK